MKNNGTDVNAKLTQETQDIYLSDDHREALLDYLETRIADGFKYYSGEASDEMGAEGLSDYFNELITMCCAFNDAKEFHVIRSKNVKALCLDMDFGICDIIRDHEDIDNPVWLYNVLAVWKKLAPMCSWYSSASLFE